MGAPWTKWDWDYVWHDLGGMAITAALCVPVLLVSAPGWVPFLFGPVLLAFGWARERYQHPFGPLTGHQVLEAVLWGAGALQTAAIYYLVWES